MFTIQEVYIAFFGRPADPAGLDYWMSQTNNGTDLSVMIKLLASSAEAVYRFGDMTSEEVVTTIYRTLFDREPDPAGLAFYVAILENGDASLETIAITILNAALGEDLVIVHNKLEAAELFTDALDTQEEIDAYQGEEGAKVGRDYLDKVNASDDSVPTERTVTDVIDQDLLHKTPPKTGGGDSGEQGSKVFDVDLKLMSAANDAVFKYKKAGEADHKYIMADEAATKADEKADAAEAAALAAEEKRDASLMAHVNAGPNSPESATLWQAYEKDRDEAEAAHTNATQLRSVANNLASDRDAAETIANATNAGELHDAMEDAFEAASMHGPSHFVVGQELVDFDGAVATADNYLEVSPNSSSSHVALTFNDALATARNALFQPSSSQQPIKFIAVDVGQDSYIFYDRDGDTNFDAAVKLTGISTTQYDFGIIAGH